MDHDLVLVIGLGLLVLSIPAMFAARADMRRPRLSALSFAVALGLIVWPWATYPGGLHLRAIPDVFYGVIGRILH